MADAEHALLALISEKNIKFIKKIFTEFKKPEWHSLEYHNSFNLEYALSFYRMFENTGSTHNKIQILSKLY